MYPVLYNHLYYHMPKPCSWSTDKIFEVRHASHVGDKFVVNIDEASCTCRKWSITRIPCCHALSAMRFLNIDGKDFISTWYKKSTYEETYASIIYPINGQRVWEVTPYPDILPPPKRSLPGRPKKKRRLQEWELCKDDTQMTKAGLRKRCRICRKIGHNRRHCPQAPATEAPTQPSQPQSQQQTPATEAPTQPSQPPSQQPTPATEAPTQPSQPPSQQQTPATEAPAQSSQPPSQQPTPALSQPSSQPPQPSTAAPRSSAQHSHQGSRGRGRPMMRPKLNARRGRIWKP